MYRCLGVGRFHLCFDQKDENEMLKNDTKKCLNEQLWWAPPTHSEATLKILLKILTAQERKYQNLHWVPSFNQKPIWDPLITHTFVRKEQDLQAQSSSRALNVPASDNSESSTKLSTRGH